MTIRRGTFTYTFMFDDTINSEAGVRSYAISDIIEECTTGHMLGRQSELVIEAVPNDVVAAEEIALGCDGTFFADPDALWDQQNGQDGT